MPPTAWRRVARSARNLLPLSLSLAPFTHRNGKEDEDVDEEWEEGHADDFGRGPTRCRATLYRGTSLIRKRPPPKTLQKDYA